MAIEQSDTLVCASENNALNDVEQRFKPLLAAAEARGQQLNKEADETDLLKVSLVWREEKISFDLPTVNMKRKEMSLHLPQVAMKRRNMSFDVVETHMTTTRCGQYPEFSCDGLKCRTTWSDIRCDLPQTRRRRVELSMDIPETKWSRTDFSLDLPEVTSARQEWKFRVPDRVDVDTLLEQQEEMQKRGKNLKIETESLVQLMQKEVAEKANALIQCHRGDLFAKRTGALAEFDKALAQVDASIQSVTSQGGDARSLGSEGGKVNLYAIRDDIVAKRAKADKDFEQAIAALDKAEKSGLPGTQSGVAATP